MKLRVLVLALASVAVPGTAVAADDFCSRLILQAVQQFCQLLPSGLNLCQPVAVMGPGPECKSPEKQALVRVPLAAPTLQFPYGAPPPAASFSYSPPPYTTPALLPPVAAVVPRVDPGPVPVLPATEPVIAGTAILVVPVTQTPVVEPPVKQDAVAADVAQVVQTPPAVVAEVMSKPETAPVVPAAQTVAEVAQTVQAPPAVAAQVMPKPEDVPATPAAQTEAEVAPVVQTPPAVAAEVMPKPEAAPATPAAQAVTDVAPVTQTPPPIPAEVMAKPEVTPAAAPAAEVAAPVMAMPAVTPSVIATEAPRVADTPVHDGPPAAAPEGVITNAAGADQAAPAIPSAEPPAAPAPVATVQAPPPAVAPADADLPQTSPSTQEIDALAHFDFDSAELTEAGRNALDAWIALAPKGKTVRITGYADRLGPEPYNLKLSLRRAQAVKEYLAGKGVNGRVVQLEARGEADPVIRCKGGSNPVTKACLAPNRRAQVELE